VDRLSEQYDVIILGAGAAGLMCAFTAAQRGRRVLVLEKANKIGKKILMSGGGRCNFTNLSIEPENYISANPHFCKSALSRYTQWDFIAMVERHGIGYEERKHGQLFCTRSAADILAMLLNECESAGVTIRTHCDIRCVEHANTGHDRSGDDGPHRPYRVTLQRDYKQLHLACDSLVIATGALSIPSLGGSDMGYDIARQFSLPLTERQAGLVPFMFSDGTRELCERLSGISLPVEAQCHNHIFAENLLFTHRGISGPAILQISNYWNPGDHISLNLLPQLQAADWLLAMKAQEGKIALRTLLNRELPKALVGELQNLWWPESSQVPLAEFSDSQLEAIGVKLNRWQLKPSATEGYRTAEVTLGGVDTNSISSKTMAARNHAGLYFIGEVLDVTGHLGGFNFQWAWSSGYTAGLFV
jgi:predicted Rossmann fold flavoprotein